MKNKKIILLVILLCISVGCGRYMMQKHQQAYVNLHPDLSPEKKHAILNGQVLRGMTKEEVLGSWGRPRKSNVSQGSWGVDEQWIYGRYGNYSTPTYLYFRNGILTSMQY